MEEIEIFLKYPLLFRNLKAQTNGVITLLPASVTERARVHPKKMDNNEQLELLPPGDMFVWSSPERKTRVNYYYGQSNSAPMFLRSTEVTSEDQSLDVNFSVKLKDQLMLMPNKHNQHWNSNIGFGRAILIDKINEVYLKNIPHLEEQMRVFTHTTHGWWIGENGQSHNNAIETAPTHMLKLALTPERAEAINSELQSVFDELTTKQYKKYQMRTTEKLGMETIEYLYDHPTNNTWTFEAVTPTPRKQVIQSWHTSKQLSTKMRARQIFTISGQQEYHQDFDINVAFSKNQKLQFYLAMTWKKVKFCEEVTLMERASNYGNNNRYRSNTQRTMYIPVIDGVTMHSSVPGSTVQPTYEVISRVRDRTKKRKVQGGYRGAYQGISKITRESTSFRLVLSNGLAAIATGHPIRSYKQLVGAEPRLPMSKETYQEIERPMANVKPIEVGHLELFRISDPPNKQVTGEILSDMQLPSMPETLLAIDSDIRITSNDDNYIYGANCSGTCDKEAVSLSLAPGLYVVKRKDKCCLGHDPGRGEYNAGFGDLCNEEITIRRLLSQLNVFYDEYRANMVGSEQAVQWSEYDSENSGSLLGRLG